MRSSPKHEPFHTIFGFSIMFIVLTPGADTDVLVVLNEKQEDLQFEGNVLRKTGKFLEM